jgi:hypothetical protein
LSKKPFHVCLGEIQVLLDGPARNPKTFSCDLITAAALGLNPVAYRKYAAIPSQNSPADGVNFATAGAGVFTSYGFTTTGAQITELQGVLATNNYNLSQSIVLYSVNGNDYGAYILENGLDFAVHTALQLENGPSFLHPATVADLLVPPRRLLNLSTGDRLDNMKRINLTSLYCS